MRRNYVPTVDTVVVRLSFIRETEAAILVGTDDGREVWIPKSAVLHEHELDKDGGEEDFELTSHIAVDKGLV